MNALKVARLIMVSGVVLGSAGCAVAPEEEQQQMVSTARVDAAEHTENYSAARGFLDSAQYGFALARIEKFLVAEPKSAKGQALAGVIYDHIARFDLADHHYKLALELDPLSVAVKNNYAMSKLQWAQASGRVDLANEALALLDQAAALDDKNEKLQANRQEAMQVVFDLQARQAAQPPVVAPAGTTSESFAPAAWLERRAANYTFVVTEATASLVDAITTLHLDPAMAMVSPGAHYTNDALATRDRLPVVTRLGGASSTKWRWYRNLPRMLFARAAAKGPLKPLTRVIHDALLGARGNGRVSHTLLAGRVERLLVTASLW